MSGASERVECPGLTIVRRIVEARGGRIEAGRSAAGAEFVVTLSKQAP